MNSWGDLIDCSYGLISGFTSIPSTSGKRIDTKRRQKKRGRKTFNSSEYDSDLNENSKLETNYDANSKSSEKSENEGKFYFLKCEKISWI